MTHKTVAADYKKKVVKELVDLIKQYPIIGAVDMENLPAPQLQTMRAQLRDSVVIRMTKRRLIRLAIEQAKAEKKDIEKIEPYLKGMPALLFTKDNPFALYKTLQKSKSSAPAKAGQTAPNDIVIPKGPTAFAPGPIIGELGMFRIKTSVEGGKVAVNEDTVVVKEGEVISEKLAGLLSRFGIEPMEIGLNLVAVYEDGTIYTKDVLAIDEEEFMNKLLNAHRWAFNLAVEAGYYTKETVEAMIPKAFLEAKAVAKKGKIMCDLIAKELVERAEREALSLKAEAKVEAVEKPKEEKKEEIKEKTIEEKPKEEKKPEQVKEEPKVEEKKEEVKPEPVKEESKVEQAPKPEPKVEEKPQPAEEKKPEAPKEGPEAPKPVEEKKAEGPKPEPEPIPEPQKIEEPDPSELLKQAQEKAAEMNKKEAMKKEAEETSRLYEELKKKGSLKQEEKKEEVKVPEKLEPHEIIKRAMKKKKEEQNK